MAIGDRTPTELIAPTALSATATVRYTNTASNRTQMTALVLSNTGSSTRVVTIYKNGTAATNQILSSITLEAGASVIIDLVGKALVFTGTQTLAAKQDTGTDVNIYATGVVEQIA
ncbi:hypothetical protein [Paenibacillus sp. PAMC21692]|uniref:hypothetical protein n=1 Tax=Paenibacillus sp. PAMC21692 TaxID=2762320 RepID=UPI00164DB6A9|nr:hypothetical protein [Paenibacillus sp. PAMC21692]QNK54572.1 hypothetical protein H7F31_18095 [Paenibacillus sp. PAMC21692]